VCLARQPWRFYFGRFNISPAFKSPPIIKLIHWQLPTHPWLKVNTDGSLVGNVETCSSSEMLFRFTWADFLASFKLIQICMRSFLVLLLLLSRPKLVDGCTFGLKVTRSLSFRLPNPIALSLGTFLTAGVIVSV